MKTARLITPLLITLLLTISAMAQERRDPADPPDLVILEKNWRKSVLRTRFGDPNRDNSLFRRNENPGKLDRAQEVYLNDVVAQPNQPTVSKMPTSTSTKPVTASSTITAWPGVETVKDYTYRVKVKNTGTKVIKLIDWEYQFLDPDTQQVKEQRTIASRVKLSPGKSQVLKRRMTRQPTIVVDASKLDKQYRDQFTERVVITRITYADGSVWRRPKPPQP